MGLTNATLAERALASQRVKREKMTETMKRAMRVMERSGFTFLGDSEVGKGPRANKRAFLGLERRGYAAPSDEGYGLVWRLTPVGREALVDLGAE